MGEIRKAAIALAILRVRLRKEGVSKFDQSELRRQLGNLSKETGISQAELKEFMESELQIALHELFDFQPKDAEV